ncbi:APC family permease, partial [Amycolatopsis sp. SID8362]|uniref:APC family permease n=1 Tax=Amycolatopsis sp. SID8362 TaxID=2690346 RepID=UPI00136F2B3A
VCVAQFTRRMAAAGSLYSLTAKGLGPGAAFACGWALLIGYAMLAMAALTAAGTYVRGALERAGLSPGWVVPAAVTLLLGAVVAVCVVRGVRLSARVVLVTEAVSISLMLVVFALLLSRVGLQSPFVAPDRGLGGIAAGVLPALGAFIGFEAATSFGVEARRPFQTVPRAMQWTAALCGVLYLVAAYTQSLGTRSLPGGLAAQSEPVAALATAQHLPWLSYLLDIGIGASFFACAMTVSSALARLLLSMGRERILPRRLGATHPRFRTPHVAILSTVPAIALAAAALVAFGASPPRLFTTLLNVAGFGYLIAYLLVCVAAPVFLHRIGELTRGAVAAAAIAGTALLVTLALFTTSTVDGGYPAVFGVLAALGLAWYAWLRLRRPRRLAEIGIYDETTAEDIL